MKIFIISYKYTYTFQISTIHYSFGNLENIDKDELKNEIQDFVNELDALLTGKNEPEVLPQKSWVKKSTKRSYFLDFSH